MSRDKNGAVICNDCGGYDIEWMYHCYRHGTDRCRGCSCPDCEDESFDDDAEDMEEPMDLEDRLDALLKPQTKP